MNLEQGSMWQVGRSFRLYTTSGTLQWCVFLATFGKDRAVVYCVDEVEKAWRQMPLMHGPLLFQLLRSLKLGHSASSVLDACLEPRLVEPNTALHQLIGMNRSGTCRY